MIGNLENFKIAKPKFNFKEFMLFQGCFNLTWQNEEKLNIVFSSFDDRQWIGLSFWYIPYNIHSSRLYIKLICSLKRNTTNNSLGTISKLICLSFDYEKVKCDAFKI